MVGRWPNSCSLGHVTRLIVCLQVKLFLPSIFNSVNYWSSMSCIVLDAELADKNRIKELRGFIDGNVLGYLFRPPKKYKPTKQAVWCTRNLHGIVWNGRRLDYRGLRSILPRVLKGQYSGIWTENCQILATLLDKEVENLDDHGCPKGQDRNDEEKWISPSYTFSHKTTLHCAERKSKLFDDWIMRNLKM